MRTAFAKTLAGLAMENSKVLLLTADLGFMALEVFSDPLPKQFFNVGVSEQNMIGMAAGLAQSGYLPFCYSIAPFATLRPYEFIRNTANQSLPIRVVGMGGGFEYGSAGSTHHALEDVAVMRANPGITTIVPADPSQCRSALIQHWEDLSTTYWRLGKGGREIPELAGRFELGKSQRIREGHDALMVSMGPITTEAQKACELLELEGFFVGQFVVSSFCGGIHEDTNLLAALESVPLVITVEEHYVNGGLGSYVGEQLAEHGLRARLLRRGVFEKRPRGGSQEFLRRQNWLAADQLVLAVNEMMARSS